MIIFQSCFFFLIFTYSIELLSYSMKFFWIINLRSEISWVNFNTYKRIVNWQPFMNRVYGFAWTSVFTSGQKTTQRWRIDIRCNTSVKVLTDLQSNYFQNCEQIKCLEFLLCLCNWFQARSSDLRNQRQQMDSFSLKVHLKTCNYLYSFVLRATSNT